MTDTDDSALLEVEDLKKYFPVRSGFLDRFVGGRKHVKAVDGVSFSVERGQVFGVVGESGCGKTTLAKTILRLHEPTAGAVRFDGVELDSLSRAELRTHRKSMQMIFQDPQSAINPRRTIGYSVGRPISLHRNVSRSEVRARVKGLLEDVGLNGEHIDRYPHQFSGGQLQRVGIARALAIDPELLIADEPVSALDASVKAKILNLLLDLKSKYDLTFLVIGHDLKTMSYICDRIAIMYLGEIVEIGDTASVFSDPKHPYTRSLLEEIPSIEGDSRTKEAVLKGEPPSPIAPPSGCRFHPRCPEFIGEVCESESPVLELVSGSDSAEGSNGRCVACHLYNEEA